MMKNDVISLAAEIRQNREKKGEFLWKLLQLRWSPRSFSNEELEREIITDIFEAGSKAASSFNEQPWSVIITGKNDEHYHQLFDCLTDFNQSWVSTAPYLAVAFGKNHFSNNNKENRHHFYDVGAFMAYASLYAVTQDVFIHQMAGFSPHKIKERFHIPEDHEPITMFVLGRRDEKEKLPEDLQEKETPESPRKAVSDFLFADKWGNPF